MVGIILLKDIKTGSYKNFKVVIFAGNNYSDISPDKPCSEYVVNIETKKIISRKEHAGKSVIATYFELMELCGSCMKFLFENPHAVCLQFKRSDNDIQYRVIPTSQGKYALPDLYNFIYGNAVYFPVKTFTFKTKNGHMRANPLKADAYCELLNYVVYVLAEKGTPLYYQAGGTLYVDIGKIIKNIRLRPQLKKYLLPYDGAYQCACKLYREKAKRVSDTSAFPFRITKNVKFFDVESNPDAVGYEFLVENLRTAKAEALSAVSPYFAKGRVAVENIFSVVHDEALAKIADKYYSRTLQYGERLADYRFMKSKDYMKYLSIRDILMSKSDASLRASLAQKANLIRETAMEFQERENAMISYDGTAFNL